MPVTTVVLLGYWIIRAMMALTDLPEPARPAAPAKPAGPRTLADYSLSELVEYFLPYLPFLKGDRAFLRAFLYPLLGHKDLLDQLKTMTSSATPFHSALEAVYYWYPNRRRGLELLGHPPNTQSTFEYLEMVIRHLYEIYPVSRAVSYLWFDFKNDNLPFRKHLQHPAEALRLYFYLTAGGNIAKAPFLNWDMGRAAARYFGESPSIFRIHRAYWYAIFRAEGMAVTEAESASLEAPEQYTHIGFWREVVRLYLRVPEEKRWSMEFCLVFRQLEWLKFGIPNEMFLRVDTAAAAYGAAPDFTLKGRTWASLMRYLNERVSPREFLLPAGFMPRYVVTGAGGKSYELRYLENRLLLAGEGEAMAHCVGDGSYYDLAYSGESTFWSFRQLLGGGRFKRLLTVHVKGLYIEEALGLANREATEEENVIVEAWITGIREAVMYEPVSEN